MSGGLLTIPDADGRCGGSKILWSRPNRGLPLTDHYLQPDENEGHTSKVRLLTVGKNAQMWNECYTEHAEQKISNIPGTTGWPLLEGIIGMCEQRVSLTHVQAVQ
jgi:hypothetical protein